MVFARVSVRSNDVHTWNYFLNTDTYQFEANFLDHGEGYSYTDYETFIQIDSILVTKERKLLRVG